MRRPLTWVIGLLLALFLVGLAVVPLTIPAFTKLLSNRVSLAQDAGLSRERIVQVAEQVREFVVDPRPGAALPSTVDGRPGFDAGAVSHLIDVRKVLSGAGLFTGILAAVLAIGLGSEIARKRTDRIADSLRAGAIMSVVLVVLAVVAATSDFDTFFSAFHGLFFKSGTWTFAYDSLLIQTFPETFWIASGVTWAGLVVAGAAAMMAGAAALRRGRASRSSRNSA